MESMGGERRCVDGRAQRYAKRGSHRLVSGPLPPGNSVSAGQSAVRCVRQK